MAKLKLLLTSLRFWQITLAAALAYIGWLQVHGFHAVDLINFVAGWLGTVAGVGTVDKAAKSIGGVSRTITDVPGAPEQTT